MTKTCCFLGNTDILGDIRELADKIRQAAVELITNKQVDTFLVGNKGHYETLCHKMMEQVERVGKEQPVKSVEPLDNHFKKHPFKMNKVKHKKRKK